MRLKHKASKTLYGVMKGLRLTPIFKVVRELKRRGVDVRSLQALDIFAGTGDMITKDYSPYVQSIEAWELEASYESELRNNLPDAVVQIVDSYEQLRVTDRRFGLVVADTWTQMFGGHCEHFELFPTLFRVFDQKTVLMLNIMPVWKVGQNKAEHLSRRRAFYGREDVSDIPIPEMIKVYERLGEQNGFKMRFWFSIDRYLMYPLRKRSKKWRLCYLVMEFQKTNKSQNHT